MRAAESSRPSAAPLESIYRQNEAHDDIRKQHCKTQRFEHTKNKGLEKLCERPEPSCQGAGTQQEINVEGDVAERSNAAVRHVHGSLFEAAEKLAQGDDRAVRLRVHAIVHHALDLTLEDREPSNKCSGS
jgi:hypothetical protein